MSFYISVMSIVFTWREAEWCTTKQCCDIKEKTTNTMSSFDVTALSFCSHFASLHLRLPRYLTVLDYGYNTSVLWPCPLSNCYVYSCVKRDHKCVVCVCVSVCVCICVGVCDTFSLCAEEKGASPRSCCSSTNLVVTVPFIPPIGHGALWQSHVFAH